MTRALLLLALLTGPATAATSLCDRAEYAQYKDRATTAEGRKELASQYCFFRAVWNVDRQYFTSSPNLTVCSAEMTKIADALRAAGSAPPANCPAPAK